MQIGFTGTQQGMTEEQKAAVDSLLDALCPSGGRVHHGDCIGADAQFHELARARRSLRIEVHPPRQSGKRAYCKGDVKWPAHDYRKRNQHIVNVCDVLIAAPRLDYEEQRSGTWMTVRMARRADKPVIIVYPDGHFTVEQYSAIGQEIIRKAKG